jgi:hypothetical protein
MSRENVIGAPGDGACGLVAVPATVTVICTFVQQQ